MGIRAMGIRAMGTDSTSEFQLLDADERVGATEDKFYSQKLHDVESWWRTPRFEGIKRPYSAEDVVSKGGTLLDQTYPSSLMAKKLFKLLQKRSAASEPVHTSASPPEERRTPS